MNCTNSLNQHIELIETHKSTLTASFTIQINETERKEEEDVLLP